MKVLELFSGIGGMHYALKAGGMEAEVVAVEINTIANSVYRHNFPSATLKSKNIMSLSTEEINKFAPDILLMSPPCQPFTRVGLNKDLSDARTDPLKHIVSLLPELTSLSFILVENVKGFEVSEAREKLVSCLEKEFEIQEFLISPIQIGVPNMRTRYYLLAKRKPLKFCFKTSGIMQELPEGAKLLLNSYEDYFPEIQSIADILETDDTKSEIFKEFLVPDKLLKRAWVMDIITKESTRSCCFTKAYGNYIEGTGSIFCPYNQSTINRVIVDNTQASIDITDLRALYLRFFTPREVARLMNFPERFTFPSGITTKQKFRLLGNSINVKVVAFLIRIMLHNPLS
uniref:tRNA (cytosine(38)-C(5))-methyltransferase n=1 Tax=Cuerna arida TaxID=1464854 RepID=A0A1B6H4C4_9HEMI